MEKADKVYFCNIISNCNIYEVFELTIRTVADNYYVGVDSTTRQAYVFTESMMDNLVYKHRFEALNKVETERSKHND